MELPTRPHPAMRGVWFLRGLALIVALFPFVSWPILLPLASLLRVGGVGFATSFFLAGGILLVGAVLTLAVWVRLAYDRFRFQIGDAEIIIQRGVVLRNVVRIPLAKVRNVALRSGPLLRRKGLASLRIVVEDRWASTPYPSDGQLPGVVDAASVAQFLVERVNRARPAASSASAPPSTRAAR